MSPDILPSQILIRLFPKPCLLLLRACRDSHLHRIKMDWVSSFYIMVSEFEESSTVPVASMVHPTAHRVTKNTPRGDRQCSRLYGKAIPTLELQFDWPDPDDCAGCRVLQHVCYLPCYKEARADPPSCSVSCRLSFRSRLAVILGPWLRAFWPLALVPYPVPRNCRWARRGGLKGFLQPFCSRRRALGAGSVPGLSCVYPAEYLASCFDCGGRAHPYGPF